MPSKNKETDELEVVGMIGKLKWNELRNLMAYELMRCENEVDFLDCMTMIANSMGNKKDLFEKRKELGIASFSEEETKLMKKLKIK